VSKNTRQVQLEPKEESQRCSRTKNQNFHEQ